MRALVAALWVASCGGSLEDGVAPDASTGDANGAGGNSSTGGSSGGPGGTGGDAGAGSSGGTAAAGGSGGTSGAGGSGATSGDSGSDAAMCAQPGPAGCLTLGCSTAEWCDPGTGCKPACTCYPSGWTCSNGCEGGSCVGFATAPSCSDVAAAIAKQTQIVGSCTAVVRFTRSTLTLLGHQFVCGKYAPTSETTARATAQQDTGFGNGTLASGPAPADEWLFHVTAGDFGGVAAVSARTGLSVFGASIVWMGLGKINWPKTWLHEPLGVGCAPLPLPKARGFVVGSGKTQPLAQPEIDKVVARLATTALPAGLAQWGYLFDAMVLAYEPLDGFTMPIDAYEEYVVLLNAGWLE